MHFTERMRRTIARYCFAALGLSSGCMLANPSRAHVGGPPVDLNAQSVAFTSRTGTELRAWFARGERVGVIGVSMGGAAALLGPGPLDANAFVLESVYPTIRQAVSNRLGTWLGPLGGVARWFTPAVIHFVSEDIGVTEAELQPIDRIAKIHAPLLLISGTDDPYTPIVEAESLYAHAPSPKTYWPIFGAGHEDFHAFDQIDYERRVGNFLVSQLRAGLAVP